MSNTTTDPSHAPRGPRQASPAAPPPGALIPSVPGGPPGSGGSSGASARGGRSLGRRVPLPGGRAIVGGLLVTVAAVATFAAYTASTTGPTEHVVVVATAVRTGQRLHASDLRVVDVDLPAEVRDRAFTTPDALEGAIALAPLEADEVVSRSAVQRPDDAETADASLREFSFALERQHALDGRVQPGEQVDLVATYGSGPDAYTTVVARRVRVLDADDAANGSVGSNGTVTLTIALASEREVLEATHALEVAKVNVVRSTRADPASDDPGNDPGGNRYTAPGPPAGKTPAGTSTNSTNSTNSTSATPTSAASR